MKLAVAHRTGHVVDRELLAQVLLHALKHSEDYSLAGVVHG